MSARAVAAREAGTACIAGPRFEIARGDPEYPAALEALSKPPETLYLIGDIQALQEGSGFIIDEIENHFHKTLVENSISMFKDKAVNKKGAVLIFSTHYCELLDLFGRNDNIWISKSEKQIILTNMYRDYSVRNDLLKSRKFYDDNFGTAVSYEMLMNLKRALMNE